MAQVKSLPTQRVKLVGSVLPNRVQGQLFGSHAPLRPVKSLGQSYQAIYQPGLSQTQEHFNHPDIPAPVARALNQLQQNIHESTAQVLADPTSNKQLLEGIALTQGTTSTSLGPTNPTIISHGLPSPYRGYRICTVRGGTLQGHAALAPTQSNPSSTSLLLWVQFKAFVIQGIVQAVLADIEVWA